MKRKDRMSFKRASNEMPNNKPIIFWDTCALLDIIRIPFRDNFDINTLKSYMRLADLIEAGDVLSVTSSLVSIEFDNNYNKQIVDLRRSLNKVKQNTKEYADYMQDRALGSTIKTTVDQLEVEQTFVDICDRITRNTVLIGSIKKIEKIAQSRVIYKVVPAIDKGEYKDCFIWTTCVMLVHEIIPTSCTIFVTSNTRDYKDANTNLPHQQLLDDCSTCNGLSIRFDINLARIEFENALGLPHI